MAFELRRNCATDQFGVARKGTGTRVGTYPTEDDAMRAAHNLGLLQPAAWDEGGAGFAVLGARHRIDPI